MGEITLTVRDQKRLNVMAMLKYGKTTIATAALVLCLSERQVYRLKARYIQNNAAGIVHRLRGRPSSRRIAPENAEAIINLRKSNYKGFNDTQFTEKLNEKEGIRVSRETVRMLLRQNSIAPVIKKRKPKHRKRRERKPQVGMMVQMDGSHHDWLEGRGPKLCLMLAVDDATSRIVAALFVEYEGVSAYLKLIEQMVEKNGIPLSVYVDMHSALKITRYEQNLSGRDIEAQLEGAFAETQVARALRELGVTIHFARSPQGKGRVERQNGTFQDRLVSELRLAGAKTLEEANRVLRRYVVDHNRRFAVHPKESECAWRKAKDVPEWRDAICEKYCRTVKNDNTISFKRRTFQIEKSPYRSNYVRKRVEVRVKLDESIEVWCDGKRIKSVELTDAGRRQQAGDRRERNYGEAAALLSLGEEASPPLLSTQQPRPPAPLTDKYPP